MGREAVGEAEQAAPQQISRHSVEVRRARARQQRGGEQLGTRSSAENADRIATRSATASRRARVSRLAWTSAQRGG